MSDVLVTGAAGFIGSHLAAARARRGLDVAGVDDFSGGDNRPAGVAMVGCDLASDEALGVVSALQPRILVHCAANAREGESLYSPEKITRANLWAYSRTLRACLEAGKLERAVCFSSMACYGEQALPFGEWLEPKPVDHYGWNKAAMEGLTKCYAPVHDFAYCILRPHNVFGPCQSMRDKFRNVVAIFMNHLLRGELLYVYGDGEQRRAFSYIEDSLECYVEAALGAGDGGTYNVGGGTHISILDLAKAVCEDFGVDPKDVVRHLPDRVAEVKNAWSTTEESKKDLGFVERIGWREGVRLMAQWAKIKGPQEWHVEAVELPRGRGLPETWRTP